ncbi:MAG: hypothetical protein ABW119_22940, partial [Candidatus Thiodiazotropha lotti]
KWIQITTSIYQYQIITDNHNHRHPGASRTKALSVLIDRKPTRRVIEAKNPGTPNIDPYNRRYDEESFHKRA